MQVGPFNREAWPDGPPSARRRRPRRAAGRAGRGSSAAGSRRPGRRRAPRGRAHGERERRCRADTFRYREGRHARFALDHLDRDAGARASIGASAKPAIPPPTIRTRCRLTASPTVVHDRRTSANGFRTSGACLYVPPRGRATSVATIPIRWFTVARSYLVQLCTRQHSAWRRDRDPTASKAGLRRLTNRRASSSDSTSPTHSPAAVRAGTGERARSPRRAVCKPESHADPVVGSPASPRGCRPASRPPSSPPSLRSRSTRSVEPSRASRPAIEAGSPTPSASICATSHMAVKCGRCTRTSLGIRARPEGHARAPGSPARAARG